MPIPTLADILKMEVSETFDNTPVPEGFYDAVITKAEVRQGPKGPYISTEVTIHDEDYKGRKVWRIVSFSEKALGMPGGVANLLQSTNPPIDLDISQAEIPATVAEAIVSFPVTIQVGHEQVVRNNVPAILPDGNPEMRATVKAWAAPREEFTAKVEAEAAGLDDDLPF